MTTFDRAAFLSAATELLETMAPSGALGLGLVPIRELTAKQRLDAVELAKMRDGEGNVIEDAEGNAQIDNAMYTAALIQMSVLDPATCEWDGEQPVPGTGSLLLKPADVVVLASKGRESLQPLARQITTLSGISKEFLFRLREELDGKQRDAEASAGVDRRAADSGGAADSGDGADVVDEPTAPGDEQPRVYDGARTRTRHKSAA
jgi:hypothetical protein